MDQNAYNLR